MSQTSTTPAAGPLAIASVEPVPEVVETLERLLERARSGELREVAIASREIGRSIATAHIGETDDLWRLLGALRLLEHRIIITNVEL